MLLNSPRTAGPMNRAWSIPPITRSSDESTFPPAKVAGQEKEGRRGLDLASAHFHRRLCHGSHG